MHSQKFYQSLQRFEHKARNSLAAIESAVGRLRQETLNGSNGDNTEQLLELLENRAALIAEELRRLSDDSFVFFEGSEGEASCCG